MQSNNNIPSNFSNSSAVNQVYQLSQNITYPSAMQNPQSHSHSTFPNAPSAQGQFVYGPGGIPMMQFPAQQPVQNGRPGPTCIPSSQRPITTTIPGGGGTIHQPNEEYRREFEKQRMMEYQRQRLHQFGAAKPTPLSAEAMISHILGPNTVPHPQQHRNINLSTTVVQSDISAMDGSCGALLPSGSHPIAPPSQSPSHVVVTNNHVTLANSSIIQAVKPPSTELRVESLMEKFSSDLTVSGKAKGFHKPKLNTGGQAMMTGSQLPPWAHRSLPAFPVQYLQALSACMPTQQGGSPFPVTTLVYEVLVSSGLSREALSQIWGLVNRTMPGQLTVPEFMVGLALVARTQQIGHVPSTLDSISDFNEIPSPNLSTFPNEVVDQKAPSSIPCIVSSSSAPDVVSGVGKVPNSSSVMHKPVVGENISSGDSTVQNLSSAATIKDENQNDSDDFGAFADFKSANFSNSTTCSNSLGAAALTGAPSSNDPELMGLSDPDPYSALRSLAEVETTPSAVVPVGEFIETPQSIDSGIMDNSFGDFAEAVTDPTLVAPPLFFESSPRNNAVKKLSNDANDRKTHSANSRISNVVETVSNGGSPSLDEVNHSHSQSSVQSNQSNSYDFSARIGSRLADNDYSGNITFPHTNVVNRGIEHSNTPSEMFNDGFQSTKSESHSLTPDNISVRSLPHEPSVSSLELPTPIAGPVQTPMNDNLYDRYAALKQTFGEPAENGPGSISTEGHVDVWTRCLESAVQLLRQSHNTFSQTSSSAVCKQVVVEPRGASFVEGIGEVYRVVCRVRLSLKSTAFQTDKIVLLLDEVESLWEQLTTFTGFGQFLHDKNSLDFTGAILATGGNQLGGIRSPTKPNSEACAMCLLSVNQGSKLSSHPRDKLKLTYAGRQYHAQCANFWVNCVDKLLPSLKLPELI